MSSSWLKIQEDRHPRTRLLQCARRCFGTFAARVASIGRLRQQERFELLAGVVKLLGTGPVEEDQPRGDPNPFCYVYGPMSPSGRRKFLERLQSARTGARQGNGRGGVFLKCPDRRNKNASRKRTSMAIHIEKTHPSRAERIKCKKGGLLNEKCKIRPQRYR